MKPLAQRITQGPVSYRDNIVRNEDGNYIADFEVSACLPDEETHANGLLICEAFNVVHETGKTPLELVQLLRDVVEAYKGTDLLGFRTVINRIESIIDYTPAQGQEECDEDSEPCVHQTDFDDNYDLSRKSGRDNY